MKYKAYTKLVGYDDWQEIKGYLTDSFFERRKEFLIQSKYKNGYHYNWYRYQTCTEVIKYTEVFD